MNIGKIINSVQTSDS